MGNSVSEGFVGVIERTSCLMFNPRKTSAEGALNIFDMPPVVLAKTDGHDMQREISGDSEDSMVMWGLMDKLKLDVSSQGCFCFLEF